MGGVVAQLAVSETFYNRYSDHVHYRFSVAPSGMKVEHTSVKHRRSTESVEPRFLHSDRVLVSTTSPRQPTLIANITTGVVYASECKKYDFFWVWVGVTILLALLTRSSPLALIGGALLALFIGYVWVRPHFQHKKRFLRVLQNKFGRTFAVRRARQEPRTYSDVVQRREGRP